MHTWEDRLPSDPPLSEYPGVTLGGVDTPNCCARHPFWLTAPFVFSPGSRSGGWQRGAIRRSVWPVQGGADGDAPVAQEEVAVGAVIIIINIIISIIIININKASQGLWLPGEARAFEDKAGDPQWSPRGSSWLTAAEEAGGSIPVNE